MNSRRVVLGSVVSVVLIFGGATVSRADEAKLDVQENIRLGLDWLAKNQVKRNDEGWWEGTGGQTPCAMTGMAGMALLLEGSTMREGKYSAEIRRAVNWFLKRAQPNGLLCNPNNPFEAGRYMYGHGFGLLFLASAYGEEDDEKKRKELEKVVSRAVLFCGKAQTDRGGWGYVSAQEGGGFDEGSVTITQLQALRAARNAGIHVPKKIIADSTEYLRKCTTPRGGIIYSLAHGNNGGDRPALTAAAVACAFSSGNYNDEYAKKWLKYCKENIQFGRNRNSHDEYMNYYFSQAVYILGDEGYKKLFPEEKDPIRWSDFRKGMFEYLKNGQAKDGHWPAGGAWGGGPVYSTAINLTILQLENSTLPIYQR